MAERADVVVIGAGLAGLTSAVMLKRAGLQVLVVEARDRVGGRTWSQQLDTGAVVEMGAEFILPGNDRIRSLASEFGVGLWDKGVRYGTREPRGGQHVDRESLLEAAAAVDRALQDVPAGRELTAVELLDSLEIDPAAREALLSRIEISAATSATEVSAESLGRIGHLDDEVSPSLAGGNQMLSLALARDLGSRVSLGDAAATVEWGDHGVQITTASGRTVGARACVFAVPASVTGHIRFSPGLPEAKASALESVRYGHAAKLFVPLAEPAPVSAVMNVPERYWCWTETGDGDRLMPLVSCFAGSPAALDSLRTEQGPGPWLESLASLRPDLTLLSDKAILSTWDDDPWVGAAYSVSPSDELTAALREPAGPFVFAGEHTAGPFHGLMEGAVRSGLAAARQLT